jgi:hypothetical protein
MGLHGGATGRRERTGIEWRDESMNVYRQRWDGGRGECRWEKNWTIFWEISEFKDFSENHTSNRNRQLIDSVGFKTVWRHADYRMYSTFLTTSSGSVLFSRSNLVKRKNLCFSCLRLGLIRHRRILKILTPFLKWKSRFCRVTTRSHPPALWCVPYDVVSLCISIHRFSSVPDLSLIFLESLEYLYWAISINSNIELLIAIPFKCFRCYN